MATSSTSRPIQAVSLIIAFLLGIVLGPSAPAGAVAQGSEVAVASSTLAYTGGWTVEATNPDSVFLLHEGESAMFSYAELPDSETQATDNDQLIETIIVPTVRDVDGYENFQPAATGTLADGTRWHSYTFVARGTPAVFLVTGNTQAIPGKDVLVTLLALRDRLASSLTAVTDGITVNGAPTPLSAVPVDQVLGQGATAPATPPASATANPATSYTGVTGQTISWSTPWALAPERTLTTADYDVIFLTDGSAWVVVATGNLAPDPARGLLLGSLGADLAAIRPIDEETQGTSRSWFDYVPINGTPTGALTIAEVDPAGTSATMTMYLGPQPTFADGITRAQAGIAIDGAPVFPGVDGNALQTRLLLSIPSG